MEPALWALISGIPAFLLGFLAYRRSVKVDAVAAQAGVDSESRAGTAQVIEGLNRLVDNLQEDNLVFRDEVKYLTGRINTIIKECDELKSSLSSLRRRYGEANGTPANGN